MVRVLLALVSFFGGVAAIACALLVPSHLRSIDEQVLIEIGKNGPTVADAGLQLLPDKVSSARVLAKVADQLNLTRTLRFTSAIRAAEDTGHAWRNSPFHSPEFQRLLGGPADYQYLSKTPFLEVLRNRATREKFKAAVLTPEAQRVLQNLTLTNTVLFAPARSAGGLPFDIAVTATAMLIDERAIGANPTSLIKDEVLNLVSSASRTNANPALEEFYLNIFAIAKRMSWEQMSLFTSQFKTLSALDTAVRWIQENKRDLPLIFTAVEMSQNGERVSNYLRLFGDSGLRDISLAVASGGKSLARLLELQQPVYHADLRESILKKFHLEPLFGIFLPISTNAPFLAQFAKFDLLILGAFLIAFGFSYAKAPSREQYLWFPRFAFVRQLVFTALLVLLIVILGEPYLVQGEAKEPPPQVQWSFPILAQTSTPTPQISEPMITASTIVTLSIFFTLQLSIYIIGLVKLAEIQRQPLTSTMKLKLLENEENLFDGGLYCGLFGTACSLVLLTLGVIKPSLISAYASTLFGILFVAILKILHVRPYKRRLILQTQSETQSA